MTKKFGDSIRFKTLRFKNFLSFGSDETVIDLSTNDVTVVMGQNFDTGGEDSRNGTGKSTAVLDTLAYAITGKTLRGISNPKLVNKLARKRESMYVELEFDKGAYSYKIIRGEQPSLLSFFRRPVDSEDEFKSVTDDNDKTKKKLELNKDILAIFGFDGDLAEFLIFNSSESTPFFKREEAKKKELVENLFGFTVLSEKAELLKAKRLDAKKELVKLESSIAATEAANNRVKTEIHQLELKSKQWEEKKAKNIKKFEEDIAEYSGTDIKHEIEILTILEDLDNEIAKVEQDIREIRLRFQSSRSELSSAEKDRKRLTNEIERLNHEFDHMDNSTCPTCGQEWKNDPDYEENLRAKKTALETELKDTEKSCTSLTETVEAISKELDEANAKLKELEELHKETSSIQLVYNSVEEAEESDQTVIQLKHSLSVEKSSQNPFIETIDNMKEKVMVSIDYSKVDKQKLIIEHYNFLIDLLSDKNSFLRKKIVDKFLPVLNRKIAYYLNALEAEHTIYFKSDLTVGITNYNQEYDYGNLSKGERNRLGFALNLAFLDIFQMMHHRINLLVVDELIDNGICNRGAEKAVDTLKDIAHTQKKKIFLITHREDIASKVSDVMMVRKENHISRIVTDWSPDTGVELYE